MQPTNDSQLLHKYNVATPRYTSYPTVPFWDQQIDTEKWMQVFSQQFSEHNSAEGLSLYLHLPFCESLCTYCGCNKKITRNHGVEVEYIKTLLKEWQLYLDRLTETPIIRELHLGGGTPTFFSPKNLKILMEGIFEKATRHPQHEFSFEGHPNNTTHEHLQTLYELGFRRVSFGVQDNDPEVQRIINRIQPIENLVKVTQWARELGFEGVNYDLIYGLPLQTSSTITKTILQTIALQPDRIAFYSYAHVPWNSRGQRLFNENDLPTAEEKLALYQLGAELLANNGYVNIGMDHFALKTDALYLAHKAGNLHRNFMGYTTQKTSLLLGLGVSSISDAGLAFAQNQKSLHEYVQAVHNSELPLFRGYFLNKEDRAIRQYILDISCRGFTRFNPADLPLLHAYSFPLLAEMSREGLVHFSNNELQVTDIGHRFIRNICSAFDLKLHRKGLQHSPNPVFSKAI